MHSYQLYGLFRYICFSIGAKNGAAEIASKYLLAESPSLLWFLVMLFDVFAIFWPLLDFLKSENISGVFLVLALYALGIIGARFFPNVFQIWTALSFVVFSIWVSYLENTE